LSTDFSTNYAPNFIQNTDILITLGNTSAKNIELEFSISYDNIENFQTMFIILTYAFSYENFFSFLSSWLGR